MKGLSREKFSRAGCRIMNSAWQLATQLTRSGTTRTRLRFIACLCPAFSYAPLFIVINGGQTKLPTMVLFVTPATVGWADDYFWLCVGAYSSDWSSTLVAGTSAPLILTHNLLQFDAKAVTISKRRCQ